MQRDEREIASAPQVVIRYRSNNLKARRSSFFLRKKKVDDEQEEIAT